MKRILLLLVFAALPARAEEALVLKEKVSIAAEIVTLNDLLQAPVAQGKDALFAAPAPGESGTISVQRVIEAAQSYNAPKIVSPAWTSIQIEREARLIKPQEIEQAIAQKARQALNAKAEMISINVDRTLNDVRVEKTIDAPLQFSLFRLDPQSGQFEARLFIPGSKYLSESSPSIVTGTLHEMAEVVQLSRPIAHGEMISKSDVSLVSMKRQQVGGNVMYQTRDVVGMLAKRALSEGTLLRNGDFEKARLVKRNNMIVIIYKTPSMMVATRGKALMDGTMGDVIEIQNLQSKRNVTATVTGNSEVTVNTLMPRRVADLNVKDE